MPVKLNSTGGGSVTLDTPSTASNYTITLPSSAGTLATTTGTGSVFTNPTINGFTGDTSVVNIGSGQFYKDTSGNVGIGTASPGAKLDVRATSFTPASTTASILVEDKSSWTQGLQFYLYNAGTYNSSRPSGGLGPANSTEMWLTSGSLITNNPQAASGITAYATAASIYRCGSGAHYWYGDTSLTAGNTYTQTERMRLDSSGNLGLGVTPSGWGQSGTLQAIQIKNTAFAGSGTNAYWGSNWFGGGFDKYITSAAASLVVQTGGQHIWYTAPSGTAGNAISFTQAMTLDASGNLLVGGTTAHGKLGIEWNANTRGIFAFNTATSGYTDAIAVNEFRGYAPNNTTARFMYCGDTGSERLTLRSNGGIANFSANNVNLSDERVKTAITPAPSWLAKINAIEVVNFKYKDQTFDEPNLGVIAQQVLSVAPELVDEDGFGETPEDGVPLMAIFETDLKYAMLKAIQELSAKNSELESRLAALEGK